MRKNVLLRPLSEAESATIRRLLLDYLQAIETAKQAIQEHLSELERRQLCTEEQTHDSQI